MRGRALRLPPARALTRALLMRHSPLDRPPDSSAGPAATPARTRSQESGTPLLLPHRQHFTLSSACFLNVMARTPLHPVSKRSWLTGIQLHATARTAGVQGLCRGLDAAAPGCSFCNTQEVCQIGQNLLRRIAGGSCCLLLCGGAQER